MITTKTNDNCLALSDHELSNVTMYLWELHPTKPTWKNIQVLFLGAILCRGQRQVSKILRVMDLSHERNFSKYHNVLRRAKWSGLNGAKILFGLLLAALPSGFPVLVAVDETLERRQGKKIKALGAYRDAVRSSKANVVISFGLKWECMALIVPLPWCQRYWALPFLTLLAPSKKANKEAGVKHKTSIEWTMKMVSVVSRWMLRKPWILLGDGAYACMDLAQHCLEKRATLISRFRLDAQLFEEPEYKPKKLGRKPIKGKRIQLRALLNDVTQPWQCAKVKWYDKNNELCFSDVLITIRNTLWREKHFSKSANNDDLYQLSEQEVNQLIYQLSLTG